MTLCLLSALALKLRQLRQCGGATEIDRLSDVTGSLEIELLTYRNLIHDRDVRQISGKRRTFSINGAR